MIKFKCLPVFQQNNNEFEYDEFPYKVGERVAQMYIEKVNEFEFEEVKELVNTTRGTGGFGSTGV